MHAIASVFIVITSILLILVVLVQNSKGGGLSPSLGGTGQILGVRKATDFLEKATWTLSIALLVFCIVASLTIPRAEEVNMESRIIDQLDNPAAFNPNAIPNVPQPGEETGTKQQNPPQQETTPVETEPVKTEPVETTPVETTPVETTPVETEPVENKE